MRLEAPAAQRGDLLRDYRWWLFCLLIVALKFVFYALDPLPKFFLGDSASYIWTAISGWIPQDRSFTYGFIVHLLAVATHSLIPLIVCQTLLAGVTAILVAFICRSIFMLPSTACYLFGFLCAIDPLQLLWERYVMTEVLSLFLYVLMLLLSFVYLRERRIWLLALVEVLGLLTISLRISYLLLVQSQAVLLPLVAFYPEIIAALKGRRSNVTPWTAPALHLSVSIAIFLLLHLGYKQLNGRLSHREPGYVYVTGINLLAMWAPALTPEDSPDPRLSQLIADGDKTTLLDPKTRGSQLYQKGFLIDRWREAEPNDFAADKIGKETAMHAFFRRPTAILALGGETYLGYWDSKQMGRQSIYEVGNVQLPAQFKDNVKKTFHYTTPPDQRVRAFSLTQRYFLKSRRYYKLVALTPLLCLALFCFLPRRSVFLLLFHSGVLLATSVFFTVTATVRYLQPLSLLLILIAAAAASKWQARGAAQ